MYNLFFQLQEKYSGLTKEEYDKEVERVVPLIREWYEQKTKEKE